MDRPWGFGKFFTRSILLLFVTSTLSVYSDSETNQSEPIQQDKGGVTQQSTLFQEQVGPFFMGKEPLGDGALERAQKAVKQAIDSEITQNPMSSLVKIQALPFFQANRYPDIWLDRSASSTYTSLLMPEILISELYQVKYLSLSTQEVWRSKLVSLIKAEVQKKLIDNLLRLMDKEDKIRLGADSGSLETTQKQMQEKQEELWVLRTQGDALLTGLAEDLSLEADEGSLPRKIPEDLQAVFNHRGITPNDPRLLNALERYAEKQGIWWILFGSLEPFFRGSPYYSAEYYLYNRLENRIVHIDQVEGRLDEFPDIAERMAYLPARIISGREWAGLQIEVIPRGARIQIDENQGGIGSYEGFFLSPGQHRVKITYPGLEPLTRRIILEPGEHRNLLEIMEPKLLPLIYVESSPEGARILSNSVPSGTTPGYISLGAPPGIISLGHPGYHNRTVVLTGKELDLANPTHLSVALLDDRIDWQYQVEYKRDRVYQALGFTIIGVAVPLVLNGLLDEVTRTLRSQPDYQTNADPGIVNLRNRRSGLYTARNLGIGLAGASIVNAVLAIIDYASAARLAQTR